MIVIRTAAYIKAAGYDSYGYWVKPDGELIDASSGHAAALQRVGMLAPKTTDRMRDSAYNKAFDAGWARVITSDGRFDQFTVTTRQFCTSKQAKIITDIMFDKNADEVLFERLGSRAAEDGGDVVTATLDNVEKVLTGRIQQRQDQPKVQPPTPEPIKPKEPAMQVPPATVLDPAKTNPAVVTQPRSREEMNRARMQARQRANPNLRR